MMMFSSAAASSATLASSSPDGRRFFASVSWPSGLQPRTKPDLASNSNLTRKFNLKFKLLIPCPGQLGLGRLRAPGEAVLT